MEDGTGMMLQWFAEILDTTMSSRSQGTLILVMFLTGIYTALDTYLVMVKRTPLMTVIHTPIINILALKHLELALSVHTLNQVKSLNCF